MRSHAFVMTYAPILQISVEGRSWYLMIRRVDGGSDSRFAAFHDKEMTADDIKGFIPDYRKLSWHKIELSDPVFGKCELAAADDTYKINVIAVDAVANVETMLTDFLRFIEGVSNIIT